MGESVPKSLVFADNRRTQDVPTLLLVETDQSKYRGLTSLLVAKKILHVRYSDEEESSSELSNSILYHETKRGGSRRIIIRERGKKKKERKKEKEINKP